MSNLICSGVAHTHTLVPAHRSSSSSCDSSETSASSPDDELPPPPTTRQVDPDKPLFAGSALTVLVACFLVVDFIQSKSLDKAAARDLWDVITVLLPEGHNLPPWTEAADLISSMSAIKRKTYDVCVNHCVIFRDRDARLEGHAEHCYSGETECPVCEEPRCDALGKARLQFSWLGITNQLAARMRYQDWRDAISLAATLPPVSPPPPRCTSTPLPILAPHHLTTVH
jgi:hypothetical protein